MELDSPYRCGWAPSPADPRFVWSEINEANRVFYEESIKSCDKRYMVPLSMAKMESLSDDMVGKLQDELGLMFHEYIADGLRGYASTRTFPVLWRDYAMKQFHAEPLPKDFWLPRGLKHDHPPRFNSRCSGPFDRRSHWQTRESYEIMGEVFNKHVAVYFENDKVARGPSDSVGRYLFRHWQRMHERRAPFQRHHFLAQPLIIFEDKTSSPGLTRLLTFHKSLCDSLTARENDIGHPSGKMVMSRHEEGADTRRGHGYQLGHLFRSLVIIIDAKSAPDVPPDRWGQRRHICRTTGEVTLEPWHWTERGWRWTEYALKAHPDWKTGPGLDGLYLKGWRESDLTTAATEVLLARTHDDDDDDESKLSAPIDFQPLFDSGRVLPPRRDDCASAPEDVVRVRLDHALEFVEGLIRREEAALPHLQEQADALRREVDELCDRWTSQALENARQVGVGNNMFTWHAMGRVLARVNGEAFETAQISPMWENIRHW